MRPGQLNINELEAAVLRHIAREFPVLLSVIDELLVLSRKYTGVGCYTEFAPLTNPIAELSDRQIGLRAIIVVPGVPSGLQVELVCEDGSLRYLEIVTYGNEKWDGTFAGFSFEGF